MERDFDIKELRLKVGWTQEDLAQFLGIDRSSVSHIEGGRPPGGAVRRLLGILSDAAAAGTAAALKPNLTSETAKNASEALTEAAR